MRSNAAIRLRFTVAFLVLLLAPFRASNSAYAGPATQAGAQVLISEIMASNRTGIQDATGDHPDWIEIYNAGESAVELSTLGLTDKDSHESAWRFEDGRLESGKYLRVFASGKDQKDRLGAWHTDFRLDADGEYLALLTELGGSNEPQLLDTISPAFPAQREDISYGRPELQAGGPPGSDFAYLARSSPGRPNSERHPALLLDISQDIPSIEADATSLIITIHAQIQEPQVNSVRLLHRTMFGPEQSLALMDDGRPPDRRAADGFFSAAMPLEDVDAGEMLRWRAAIVNAEEQEIDRFPLAPTGVDHEFYAGTIRENRNSNLETKLPVLHWFLESPEAARSPQGTMASLFFNDRFYDAVHVSPRGFTTRSWAKSKFKMDMPPGQRFTFSDDERPVEEFNLQSHYRESETRNSSYLRETVAFEYLRATGVPASLAFHLQLRQNGEFYGLYSFVEQVDETFLERNGLDPEGPLYKAAGSSTHGTLQRRPNPGAYKKVTKEDEPWDDFVALTEGINSRHRYTYLMDYIDVPQVINDMAANALMPNHDRLPKNYYMYLEPDTGLWHRFPWDMDHSFALGGLLNRTLYNHPLYGNEEHFQLYENAWNRLFDAILDYPSTREMYLRRLRSLLDEFTLAEPGSASRMQKMLEERAGEIRRDAERDHQIWRAGPNGPRIAGDPGHHPPHTPAPALADLRSEFARSADP